MSEIEKMMQNAGIKPIAEYCKHQCNNEFDDDACIGCKYIEKVEYPPFTAEKQIEILKIIVHSYGFNSLDKPIWDKGWDIAIAKLVNFYWEVLTTKEKQQVKGILE